MTDKPRSKPPNPKPARDTPAPENLGTGGLLPPAPGSKPPVEESPHDFVRRKMRELRDTEAKKND